MFCMNCGQTLPDGAKFCMSCGTPQGAVSPTVSTGSETLNLNGSHTFVPAMCPNCNAHMKVDSSSKIARCDACGTECLVQDAIKALNVRGNVQVGNATINVNGTNTESLLKRVEILLADGDFDGAMTKCDTILDSDPTNGKAYFFMLMSDLGCRNINELANLTTPFDQNQYYVKAIQFGDESVKAKLIDCADAIKNSKEEIRERLSKIEAGDEIFFGTNNGQKIWWDVLIVYDHMALIISNDCICYKPYHQFDRDITWSDCTLRQWLNNEFINGFLTHAEKTKIQPIGLNNDDNIEFNTSGGIATNDQVFLLSIHEAKILFANDQARASGSMWWLRSPGSSSNCAAYVLNDGEVFTCGLNVADKRVGVRPAMWLNLD